jgi:two-component system, cell cycle sensor histidine kinase and response regulator CckA
VGALLTFPRASEALGLDRTNIGISFPFFSPHFRPSAAVDAILRFSRTSIMLPSTVSTSPISPAVASPVPPRGNGELILVVDDQQAIRDLLATVLTGHGYRTLVAVDGNDALGVFQRETARVAAVITDLNMPHVGGASLADLVHKLRAEKIPILFMSGTNGTAAATRHSAVLGASQDPFLPKPFRPVALLQAIHQLLQVHGTPKP